MTCTVCDGIVERPDIPHVLRLCPGCGREMRIHEPGDHGRGLQIQAGDRFVIPAGWLKLSLNPLQSTGTLSKAGLEMLAAELHLQSLHRSEEGYLEAAATLERY